MRLTAFTRRRARIEIIPLIDIIFFLLATFVMVSLSMIKNEGMSVNLPSAATGTPQERKIYTTITVSQEGEIFLNREKTTHEALMNDLEILKNKNPDLQIFIQADEKSDFGAAMKVLDGVRGLGITKVSIQTKPAEKP